MNQQQKRIHREVRFGSYILGSTLGEGEFGKVKLGWRKDGKQPSQVAIKLIKRDSIMKDSESEIKIHREINSLKLLNHPNIVNLVEVMKSGKYIGIVLEYASGGELFDYILHHKNLKENVAKKIFAQLVSGVDYMHSKGLIHRDLKLENLLLDKYKNVIISDFGFVNSYNKDKNDLMKTSCGSPCYAAPELVLTQSPYEGKKCDIWSLGIILYAMLAGYLPFDDDPENEDGSDIIKLYHYICKTPLTFPEYISPLARDLLRKIIVSDPKKRINMDKIRNHPWLSPYANLLSIRQPEWDRIYKENNQVKMTPNPTSKRFSMINEQTNSNLLVNNHLNLKFDAKSFNNNIIYNKSSHPTTSSSFTNVVALNDQDNLSPSPFNSHPNSPNKYKGHTKAASISNAYSPASSALKAVVSDSISSIDLANDSQIKNTYLPHSHIARSTTYSGTISTIVESPTKMTNEQKFNSLVETLPAMNNNSKLPHNTKKPRPTSYHPSSLSSNIMQSFNNNNEINGSSNLFDYIKMPSPINLPIPQFLANNSPPKNSSSSSVVDGSIVSSPNNSPGSNSNMPITSRRNSVVTHVHANGQMLTNESVNGSLGNLNSHENKRNSVLSYLEDRIEGLELGINAETTPKISQNPVFDTEINSPEELRQQATPQQSSTRESESDTYEIPILENTPDLQIPEVLEPQAPKVTVENVTPVQTNDANTESQILPELRSKLENQLLNNSTTELKLDTLELVDNKPKELLKPADKIDSASKSDSSSNQSIKSKTGSSGSRSVSRSHSVSQPVSRSHSVKKSKEAKTKSSSKTPTPRPKDTSNKENREAKKRNRFSILSFYSTYSSSSSNLVNNESNEHINTTTKKVLEPSSDSNINKAAADKNQKRINSSSSSASKKSSHSGASAPSNNVNGKEASAARKVMDFFKRRSIRIT